MANIVLSILGNAEGANRAVKSVEGNVEGMKGKAAGVGGIMAGVFGGGMLIGAAEKVKDVVTESVDKLGELADNTRDLQRIMGGSDEQVSAFIAVGDRYGITTQSMAAGTAIAAKAIATGKDHFKDYGIATKNADGSLKSLSDIMPEAVAKISALHGSTAQAAAAQQLFGRGGKDLLPILTMGKDRFDEYEESARKSGTAIGGDAVNSAFKYQQAQKELGEAVEGAQIQLGTKLYPVLVSVAEWVTQNLVPAFRSILDFLGKNKEMIPLLVGAIGTLVVGLMAVTAAEWAMSLTPVTLIIAGIVIGIAALVAAIVELVTHWNDIVGFLRGAWASAVAWLQGSFRLLIRAWQVMWSGIASFFHGIWNGIVDFGVAVVRNYIGASRTLWSGIIAWLRNLLSGYLGFWRDVWNNIVNFVAGIPNRIRGFFAGVGGWLRDAGRNLIGGFINGIKDMVGGAVNAVSGVVQAVANFFPHSPAKAGPFSGQGYTSFSGAALMDDFGGGMASRAGALKGTVSNVLSGLVPSLSLQGMGIVGAQQSAAAVAGGGGMTGGAGMHIENFHAHANQSPYEIAQELGFMSRVG